jgi:hypothetical protein
MAELQILSCCWAGEFCQALKGPTGIVGTLVSPTGHRSLEMLKTYSRDAEAFVGHAGAGLL